MDCIIEYAGSMEESKKHEKPRRQLYQRNTPLPNNCYQTHEISHQISKKKYSFNINVVNFSIERQLQDITTIGYTIEILTYTFKYVKTQEPGAGMMTQWLGMIANFLEEPVQPLKPILDDLQPPVPEAPRDSHALLASKGIYTHKCTCIKLKEFFK